MKLGVVVALAAAAVVVCACTITLHEDPRTIASIDSNTRSVQALTRSVDEANAAGRGRQAPQHVICSEVPGDGGKPAHKLQGVEEVPKGAKDLGLLQACPPPNEVAPCVGTEPLSNVDARCAQGKI